MSLLRNSSFGKRLRTSPTKDENEPPRNRARRSSAPCPKPDPVSKGITPRKAMTPRRDYGDRFVPSRDATDIRIPYNMTPPVYEPGPPKKKVLPIQGYDARREQANSLFSAILRSEVTPPTHQTTTVSAGPARKRLFSYSVPAASSSSQSLESPSASAYSTTPVDANAQTILAHPRPAPRSVAKMPYRILDAPEIADDFYYNLLDWSSRDELAVGLGSNVYLLQSHDHKVRKLCSYVNEKEVVSGVAWSGDGTTLAVSTGSGRLAFYSDATLQLMSQCPHAHSERIAALTWTSPHVIASGSHDRLIRIRDMRIPLLTVKEIAGHKQEVCGLKYDESCGLLASGGNDNKVCVWDLRSSVRSSVRTSSDSGVSSVAASPAASSIGANPSVRSTTSIFQLGGDVPLYTYHHHKAAVKALAWSPHTRGVLATGGGTQDRMIRVWHTGTGAALAARDTGAQVCSMLWSKNTPELVSSHGFAANQVCIWRYRDRAHELEMVAGLVGHVQRVLYMGISPDGETVVTGAGDETLRFWQAFPKKGEGVERRESALDWTRAIR